MMRTKLTLFVAVLTVALFGMGCASTEPAFVSDGLVAYYPFNGNVKDESGNGNDGQAVGIKSITDRHGKQGRAFRYDGVDDFIFIEHSSEIDSNNITITGWVKVSVDAAGLLPFMSGSIGDIFIGIDSNHLLHVQVQGSNAGKRKSHSKLNNDIWHFIGVSYDGDTLKFYLDGKLDGLASLKAQFKPSLNKSIGSEKPDYENYFNGSIDDVRIYNRALSAEEVKALYDLEKPKGK